MLLAKSRPMVVICIADGSHFARERLMAFTPWHLDAVSGSHPPHLLSRVERTCRAGGDTSEFDQNRDFNSYPKKATVSISTNTSGVARDRTSTSVEAGKSPVKNSRRARQTSVFFLISTT